MSFLSLKEKYNYEYLIKLVNDRIERSINLEFRQGNELSLTNQQKINKFAITVAAFANTTGGILIYGIETRRNKAHSFSYADGNFITADWIKNILSHKIQRAIPGLEVFNVVFDNSLHKVVYIIIIPQSHDAPHMSFDNRYYKRNRFSNIIMEEHEIRMMYKSTGVSDLDFFALLNTNGVPLLENGKMIRINFYPRFLIKNISNIIEHSYKFEISFPSAIYDNSFTALQEYFVRFDGVNSVFSIPNRSPIFQDEIATVLETKLVVNNENFEIFSKNKLLINLYFTNGVKSYSFNLPETFIYKSKQLQIGDFVSK
jgi:hypothetical protein